MSEGMWMVAVDGSQLEGEYGAEEVTAQIARDPRRQVLVWNETMPAWADPRSLPAFKPPAAPAPATAAPPVPRPARPAPPSQKAGTAPQASGLLDQLGSALGKTAAGRVPFVAGFLDFGFETFITPAVVGFIYLISIALVGLGLLVTMIMAVGMMFSGGGPMPAAMGFAILVGAPIAAVLHITIIRVFWEIVLVLFRIRSSVEKIAASKGPENQA